MEHFQPSNPATCDEEQTSFLQLKAKKLKRILIEAKVAPLFEQSFLEYASLITEMRKKNLFGYLTLEVTRWEFSLKKQCIKDLVCGLYLTAPEIAARGSLRKIAEWSGKTKGGKYALPRYRKLGFLVYVPCNDARALEDKPTRSSSIELSLNSTTKSRIEILSACSERIWFFKQNYLKFAREHSNSSHSY